jgi:hypothetical protein
MSYFESLSMQESYIVSFMTPKSKTWLSCNWSRWLSSVAHIYNQVLILQVVTCPLGPNVGEGWPLDTPLPSFRPKLASNWCFDMVHQYSQWQASAWKDVPVSVFLTTTWIVFTVWQNRLLRFDQHQQEHLVELCIFPNAGLTSHIEMIGSLYWFPWACYFSSMIDWILECELAGLLIMWSSYFIITLDFMVDNLSESETAITAVGKVHAVANLQLERPSEKRARGMTQPWYLFEKQCLGVWSCTILLSRGIAAGLEWLIIPSPLGWDAWWCRSNLGPNGTIGWMIKSCDFSCIWLIYFTISLYLEQIQYNSCNVSIGRNWVRWYRHYLILGLVGRACDRRINQHCRISLVVTGTTLWVVLDRFGKQTYRWMGSSTVDTRTPMSSLWRQR